MKKQNQNEMMHPQTAAAASCAEAGTPCATASRNMVCHLDSAVFAGSIFLILSIGLGRLLGVGLSVLVLSVLAGMIMILAILAYPVLWRTKSAY